MMENMPALNVGQIKEAPDFNSFFKIKNLEHQIQEKDNVIRDLKVLVSNVNDRSCEPYNANDVTDLLEQNERFRAEIEKVKQHYKELFESIKITRASTNEHTSSLLTQIDDLKAQLEGNLKVASNESSIKRHKFLCLAKKFTLGKLNCGYQWRPTGKKFALGELCPLTKLSVQCRYRSSFVSGTQGGCSKYMMGISFKKLKTCGKSSSGSVSITGMITSDYQRLRRLLLLILKLPSESILALFVILSRSTNLYTILIDDMIKSSLICLLSKASKSKSWLWQRRLNHLNFGTINDLARKAIMSVPRTPQQNGVVKRRNHTLVEAARTMLIFSKAPMFLWAEAVATAYSNAHQNIQAFNSPEKNMLKNVNIKVGEFIGEPSSTQSTSGDVSLTEPNQVTQPRDHLRRWTKDHPLDNIVGKPSRPVSTRKQLASDALWCCFHTELSKVEPKNFKMAVIEDCWFQAMQDEIHEFDRLEVWELVPPHQSMVMSYRSSRDLQRRSLCSQPEGFEDQDNLHTLLSSEEGSLRLKQQPRAWYDTLSNHNPCHIFSKEKSSKFADSMNGTNCSFFLGLQVSQSPRGIFINQAKYALETLKKYVMDLSDPVDTPMVDRIETGRGLIGGFPVDQKPRLAGRLAP
ncbi:retrovirus-related pol polyprotein from transposon TNT 1-94 [Tanacetum coccineum]